MRRKLKLKISPSSRKKEIPKVFNIKIIHDAELDIYVPPIDVTATSVDKIYPLDRIFTPEQYEAIYNEMTQKEFQLEFTNGVRAIYNSSTFTKEQTVLAMFITGLHKLACVGCHKRALVKFTPIYSSETLNQYILQNFNESYRKQRHRLLIHALVFYLLINKYRVNLHEFADEFNLKPQYALRICVATGATVQLINAKRFVILKLPLAPRRFSFSVPQSIE